MLRAYWTRLKVATAVWTRALVNIICASGAKSTFERAHHRRLAIWRKITITMFAIWTKLEHWFVTQACPPDNLSPRTRNAPDSRLTLFSADSS
jgi:hypothetical protein